MKPCENCIVNKDKDAVWCRFSEYCDIYLSNGCVFEDVVQSACHVSEAASVEDIEFEFHLNQTDAEGRAIFVRAGDIVAIVERHKRD